MTDELRVQRAKSTGNPGLADYLTARATKPPHERPRRWGPDLKPVERCTAERDGTRCGRGAGHTGPHQGPANPESEETA